MMRPGSALSKAKNVKSSNNTTGANMNTKTFEHKILQLSDHIKNRDWVGAIAFLENDKSFNDSKSETNLWLSYAYFHNGDYRKAISIYDEMMKKPDYNKELHVYKSCCLYALTNYDEAKRECLKSGETPLYIRLMLHIAHKKNDEKNLQLFHPKIQESTHDQLCLAAVHYLRSHYEEAVEIYKKLLIENKENLALNVYIALCYYKMDYYDVSMEILSSYLALHSTSIIAVNLKACNQFQLYNGKAAEQEYKVLQNNYQGGNLYQDYDILRHNLVVFRNGENSLQVLPPLVEIFPEARLNLVIYHLKNDDINQAYNLIKDIEPTVPREYIIKGVVFASLGQQTDNKEHLKVAQQLFQMVGASASECDTIPGRQCMASCFFLLKHFDDVLVYLKSIKTFFENDDDFNWNYGIACASTGDFKEAEDAFAKVQNEKYRIDETFIKWQTKIYIMNSKPKEAWDLYINMETSNESLNLLQLIANECYRMGQFYYAAKAFDILERLDSDKEYEQAFKGAVVGIFQMMIAGKETKEHLIEVLNMLKAAVSNDPQVEYVFRIIKKWGKDNGLKI